MKFQRVGDHIHASCSVHYGSLSDTPPPLLFTSVHMTVMSDEKKKPVLTRTKSTKTQAVKGQKTLLDMFGRKPGASYSQTASPSLNEQPRVSASSKGDPHVEPSAASDCGMSLAPLPAVVPNPLRVSLPVTRNSAEIPATGDRCHIQLETTLIELDDDGVAVEPSSQGSKNAPIVVESSPIKLIRDTVEEGPRAKPRKPLHPFFVPTSGTPNVTTQNSPRHRRTRELEPAYPNQESQHVKGPQSLYSPAAYPFPRRMLRQSSEISERPQRDDPTALLKCLSLHQQIDGLEGGVSLPTIDPKTHITSINRAHIREHPAIARTVDATFSGNISSSISQLWTEAWRPRCAKEVLGNERSAMYLRNWLYTLALQLDPPLPEESNKKLKKRKAKTNKRSRVVREVPRKRLRKDGLDGFVVEDEDDELDISQSWETQADTAAAESSQSSGLHETSVSSVSDAPERISGQLHNTILLTGPSGSGKTAAVFACAEELGWEVFEVYPGIGRRNGANVDNLVGDVGKNHLVRRKQQELPIASQSSDGARSSGAGDCGDTSEIVVGEGIKRTFRQSLILLEEVDLLFKDDVNFWPAVTNLIRDCRRPVICTCNDASLVPKEELPLQKVLCFEPCDPDVATSYLLGLTCAEGYTVSPEIIREVCSDTYELGGEDKPSDTNLAAICGGLPRFDLRRAIHNVQVWSSTGSGERIAKNRANWDDMGDWVCDVENLGSISELASYLDSSMRLPGEWRREGSLFETSTDDENGYAVLYGSPKEGDGHWSEEMAIEAIRLAHGRPGGEPRVMFREQERYQKATGREMQARGVIGRAGEREIYMEYVPYVRWMVGQARAAGGGEGRVTRNSSRRAGWEVVRRLGERGQEGLAETGLATWGGGAVAVV